MKLDLDSMELSLKRLLFGFDRATQLRLYFNLASYMGMSMSLSEALDQLWMNETDDGRDDRSGTALALQAWRQGHRYRSERLCDVMRGWVPDRDRMVIRAGEKSGLLRDALMAAREVDDVAEEMKSAIQEAVGYPILILALVTAVIWSFGINLFGPLKKSMPKVLMSSDIAMLAAVSEVISAAGLPLLIVGVGVAVAIAVTLPHLTGRARVALERIPPWCWYKDWYQAAFLLSFAALMKSSVAPKEAVEELLVGANPYMRERMMAIWRGLKDGNKPGDAMLQSPFNFPDRSLARDIRAMDGRADFGQVLDVITRNWIKTRVMSLRRSGKVVKAVGLAVAGGVIMVSGLAIIGLSQAVMSMGASSF